jgi:hypothetical protein
MIYHGTAAAVNAAALATAEFADRRKDRIVTGARF